MVRLEIVNESTFRKVVDMKLGEGQNRFVAPNVVSLAQAWLYYGEARPYAILDGDKVVGFMMLDWDEGERTVGLWRFMIAPEEQRKGYGKAAVQAFLDLIRNEDAFDLAHLDYVKENTAARNLYASFGFSENGDEEDGEIIMTLPLTDSPKVGRTTADEEDLDELLGVLGDVSEPEKTQISGEYLKSAIAGREVSRYTLMGEAIGFAAGGKLVLPERYKNREKEIREKYGADCSHEAENEREI